MDADVPWVAVVFVFVFAIGAYVAFMIFLPEWVGITGKTALENEKAHSGEGTGQAEGAGESPSEKTDSFR